MIPTSFSATSLQVAQLCLARYKSEFIEKGRGIQGTAANVGIVLHGTLEEFIRAVFIRKDTHWDENIFWNIFHNEFARVFGPDQSIPEYKDAKSLGQNWLRRPGLAEQMHEVRVISVETKNYFNIKPIETIPINYIMDRLEEISPGVYRVVDYKTNRVALTAEQLRKKIQARLYALAVQIKFPDAKQIWVEFDFLRHGPIGTVFTREDNIDTFRMLQRAIKRILETDGERPEETLNTECGWCVRKASCKTLQKNIAVGGILGLSLDDMADVYRRITAQKTAQEYLLSEIEQQLLNHAIEQDVTEYETDSAIIKVTAQARRKPNHAMIATILGPELSASVGSFRVSDIDELINSGALLPGQVMLLKAAMPKELGEAKIKIEMKDSR